MNYTLIYSQRRDDLMSLSCGILHEGFSDSSYTEYSCL
jgi:hypothetical protein